MISVTLPNAIWMPDPSDLPACYQGSPVEMVSAMAEEMRPGLSLAEAIDHLLRNLGERKGVRIQIPESPAEVRASYFVAALLVTGIARPMAQA